MNPRTMANLGIRDRVEVVVGGKRRLVFSVLPNDKVPENEVWCNADELRELGVADNTVAATRAPLTQASGGG